MRTIEVSAETDIDAAPADIAGVMFDPAREPEWITPITAVELIDPALVPGARVRRTGSLMGKTVSWTTEVETVHFPHVLALKITDGPVSASVRYDIQRSGSGSRVRIRGVGDGSALGFLPDSLVTGPARSALTAALGRLKAIVEGTRN